MTEQITLATLRQNKRQGRAITMLTCYDYTTARLLQEAQIDGLIVGDSLAQVVLGHQRTLSATMDIMITLTAAVRRGAPNVYLVGDMPFLSYQTGTEKAILNAGRFLIEAGCDAVKLEVDYRYQDLVAAMAKAGIPVMAHLGYRPQTAQQNDKIVHSRTETQAQQLVHDVFDMIEAGACLILLECVTDVVAKVIAEHTEMPIISCGSGPYCDGQVLVLHDILGLTAGGTKIPKFARVFADLGEKIKDAVREYIQQVQQKHYPDEQHCYHMDQQEQQKVLAEGWFDRIVKNKRQAQ